MSNFEQITAPGYPEDRSEIVSDAFTFGYLNALLEDGVRDYGNDHSLMWPSYTEEDVRFRATYDGEGETIQEGKTWPIWLVEITRSNKTKILRVDVANCTSKVWSEEGFQPASFKDHSDLIAAGINLREFNDKRLDEGDSPLAVFRRTFKSFLELHED